MALHPDDDGARRRLFQLVTEDEAVANDGGESALDPQSHKLAGSLKNIESPGELRKAGPSLRYLASKVDAQFLFGWIQDPTNFRPSTRMPKFFGHFDHLEKGTERPDTKQLEQIEIRGMVNYLLGRSQPFDYAPPESGITESSRDEMVLRGKQLFQMRGCLACHNHDAFADVKPYRPKEEIVQGPDLSDLAAKFDPARNPDGGKWLYSWLKNPSRYHARTLMPDTKLRPIDVKDADGKVTRTDDPAKDIVAFLLHGQAAKWKAPKEEEINLALLDDMVRENLQDWTSVQRADMYLRNGVPESEIPRIKGAEIEMVVTKAEWEEIDQLKASPTLMEDEIPAKKKALTDALLEERKLLYIGRKSIAKYGCYGCHDIPGFEDAKPIGTGLANWGRKETSKLAFEHITQYLGNRDGKRWWSHKTDFDEDSRTFYEHALKARHRVGFIYQKLREPRSFDYHKTPNIRYNERLRMPQFNFTDQEREAVITFVLGLIAEPPAGKFVYKPSKKQEAIIAGRKVIDKYNCAGCHVLELEKWEIAYPKGRFDARPPPDPLPFPSVQPQFSHDELAKSKATDRRGNMHATLVGLPSTDAKGVPMVQGPFDGEVEAVFPGVGYDPQTLRYRFDLWKPVALEGNVYQVKQSTPFVSAEMIERRYPTWGGTLTKYLIPRAVKMEKAAGSDAKGVEVLAWLPPTLVGEGKKVQSDWLQEFLLNPFRIRPAVVLEMPKFNMSPEEARQIADYFVAVEDADYPYEMDDRQRRDDLAKQGESALEESSSDAAHPGLDQDARFDAALNIIADKNGCQQCHTISDFAPGGNVRGNGPDLALVYRRLRPAFVRDWIARPMGILPYTGMPINVKYVPGSPHLGGVSQKLYPGTSIQQLDGLTEFLMNFDVYTARQVSIKKIVEERKAASEPDPKEGNENTDVPEKEKGPEP
ncbi:MAG: c-type cytochrome [Planctomycetes bacterium]|nr:c-type cytochrome [Planctomycetota bacterium]